MKSLLFLLPLIGILLVSGCTGSTTGGFTGSLPDSEGETQLTGGVPPFQEARADAGGQETSGAQLDVAAVKTDKDLYHSAEVMKLSAVISASGDAPDTLITATGINGKMSLSQTVDLSAGDNTIDFEYQLPRCNVCGGIREGNYTCTISAAQGGSSSSQDFSVEIRQ